MNALFQGNKRNPISHQWKEEEAKKRSTADMAEVTNASVAEDDKLKPPVNSNSASSELNMTCSPGESDEVLQNQEHRKSNRSKKAPQTRRDGFLWT